MTKVIDAVWKKVSYLRQGETFNYDHEIYLPEPLASWDVYTVWEKERTRHMQANLNPSDILFDIGSESGWLSVVYAKFCKVFLIEPTREWWPNIFQIWTMNRMENPLGCFSGLVGDKTDTEENNFDWPKDIEGDLLDHNKYEYLHEHTEGIKSITIDDLVDRSGIIPTALTIDVEGAELLVLTGAVKTLKANNLKVWVSEHPDLALQNFNFKEFDTEKLMASLGYTRELLAIDHEVHAYYHK